MTILELGCGQNVPTLRNLLSEVFRSVAPNQSTYVRVNPKEGDLAFNSVVQSHEILQKRRRIRNQTNKIALQMKGLEFAITLLSMK